MWGLSEVDAESDVQNWRGAFYICGIDIAV